MHSGLVWSGNVAAFLEEKKVKDIRNKDQLTDALGAAMKRAANEELAVQEAVDITSNQNCFAGGEVQTSNKDQPLEECRGDGGVYAEPSLPP